MSVNFEGLREALRLLETKEFKVYRDEATSNAKYPYIIYEFVNEIPRRSSNKLFADMPLYQIAYVTRGIESELAELKRILNENKIVYSTFTAVPYDENDDKVTQFVTYVRCVNG